MSRPVPLPTAETRPFWEACNKGELLYQRCRGCGHVQSYPRGHCEACQALDLEWKRSSGRGSIYTFTVAFRAPTAAFKADVPYAIAIVDMDEGFRLMVNILNCEHSEIAIGGAIRIVFKAGEEGMVLPQAELA